MLRTLALNCLLIAVCGQCLAAAPEHLAFTPGVQNVFKINSSLFSGSQPEGETGFDTLRQLGIKTIISVDGAIPEVEAARARGIRYIHLPIGYDGISTNRLMQLATVAATIEDPIYVHCHHGRHRGPAAAAILCLAGGIWTPTEAMEWLRVAGTSTNYQGLYESIREHRPPSPEEVMRAAAEFPEISTPSGLVQSMVAIDEHHEHLKSCRSAGWTTPPDEPDISPAHEALLLWEQFKELQRTAETSFRSPDFQRRLSDMQAALGDLHEELQGRSSDPDSLKLNSIFDQVTHSCTTCHSLYRD